MLKRPITFACKHTIAVAPTAISAAIADVTRWRDFKGYGFLPGIIQSDQPPTRPIRNQRRFLRGNARVGTEISPNSFVPL